MDPMWIRFAPRRRESIPRTHRREAGVKRGDLGELDGPQCVLQLGVQRSSAGSAHPEAGSSSFAARPADVASANATRRDRIEPPIERRSATGTQGAGRTSRGLVLADKVPAIDDAKRLGVGERDALTALAFLPATTYGVARTARRRTEERAMASKLGKRRGPSRSMTLPRR